MPTYTVTMADNTTETVDAPDAITAAKAVKKQRDGKGRVLRVRPSRPNGRGS
jgi:hypothetical protein